MPTLKDHVTTLLWLGGIAVSIVTTGIAVDSRYAHSEEVRAFKHEQNQAIYESGMSQARSLDKYRKAGLEDKIFEIEQIPPSRRTQTDIAKLERYKRQLAAPIDPEDLPKPPIGIATPSK